MLFRSKFEIETKNIENCSKQNIQSILKEFYKRFIIPFYIPVLSLIPFLLITTSKENSKYNKLRINTFLIGFFIIIFSETTIRFVSNIHMQNFILIAIPLNLLLFFYLFLFYKFKTNIKF